MSNSQFKSGTNKQTIRNLWNSPLLNFLVSKFKKKLIYFGLPSPEAEDLNDWIEFIDYVIAFQCREYPKPSNPNQNDNAILELEKKLNRFERIDKIKGYDLYDGYIEEVIINGKDNSGLPLKLNDFITLYNLDFCNEITYPQSIYNAKSNKYEKVYKLQIIKNIIDLQRSNNDDPMKFVLFLTVNARLWEPEAKKFVQIMSNEPVFGPYLKSISKLSGLEQSYRIHKAYVFHSLSSFFCTNNYVPEFLPVIKYKSSKHTLLHFSVIGTFEETPGRPVLPKQDKESFLSHSFLKPNKTLKVLEFEKNIKLAELNIDNDPVNSFTKTLVANEMW